MSSNSSDHGIAVSYAIGTFIAVFPTPGVSALVTLFVAAIFKKLNRAALLISQAVWNAFTVLPIYWLSLEVGKWLFPSPTVYQSRWEWVSLVIDFAKRFIIGNLFVSIPLSILSYYLARWGIQAFKKYRNRKIRFKHLTRFRRKKGI